MRAVQAAVTQKHSQQGLVALQPVSSAPLVVMRTPSLKKVYCISFIHNVYIASHIRANNAHMSALSSRLLKV